MEDVNGSAMQDTDPSPTGPPAGGLAASGDTPVGTSVYVGNLSWATRWQGLKDHMRQAGEVVHAEVFTESSGRSAGCGTVEYETVDAATRAIATLNETELDGRNIFVRVDREQGKSRPRRSAPGAGGGGFGSTDFAAGGGGGGGRTFANGRGSDRGRKIVVWNLQYHLGWQDLKDLFREFGPVIRADVPTNPDGRSKGMGTVLFENEADAQRAIDEMTGKEVNGRVIDCRLDRYAN